MGATIFELLKRGEDHASALGAPGREPLSFWDLRRHVETIGATLNTAGIGREDPVAIVLPNGPEMATAFLSVAACATAAPLNPDYRAAEFDFYLGDLEAKALVLQAGSDSPARAVAAERGIPVIDLAVPNEALAGVFDLDISGLAGGGAERFGLAERDDVALLLHTSGTTSRPKIVPLTHTNLTASAENIRFALELTPDDRCLNVMPLFHIHGLVAGVLASLAGGASVWATPGFDALKVFRWFDEVEPSWYTAVPSMHQAIVARAARNADSLAQMKLRLIRSSSAPMPTQVLAALEETFGCPVVESYGMTEAAHQITSNPLPPRERKPGTVGIAAGPQVAVLGADGKRVPSGVAGEIVIKGENVTKGYRNNPTANAEAFVDGWFRTGDQGVMDPDGYLTITGRLKELINRGGEKISPREVDEVLMDHPAVASAVTFALPHPKLGEVPAAAIVLEDGQQASEQELKDFAATRLSDFKVPRKLVFVPEIPKGATGKLQRIGLAEKLGLVS